MPSFEVHTNHLHLEAVPKAIDAAVLLAAEDVGRHLQRLGGRHAALQIVDFDHHAVDVRDHDQNAGALLRSHFTELGQTQLLAA